MSKALNSSEKVTLFSQHCCTTYRIPALMFIPSDNSGLGTFLAFAEERCCQRDECAKYLVLRRGQKKGESTEVQWGPMERLTRAKLSCYRTMNPCPVYDQKNKTVFLFFICVRQCITEQCQTCCGSNAARLCYIHSTDVGQTWSSLTDLTDQVIGEELKDWATFAVGPGHGVQLHSGRLVIPAYAYYITPRCCCLLRCCSALPHSLMFYSDDGGTNWKKGELMQGMGTLECQVAELVSQNGDTILYCNTRTKTQFRAEARSKDPGVTFESPSLCKELSETDTGCQGSVVSFLPKPKATINDTSSRLLFSHPTGKERKDLGIYLNRSPSQENKWEALCVLYEGPSSYSDLAVCEGSRLWFGCLFECGEHNYYEEIAFQLFTHEEL